MRYSSSAHTRFYHRYHVVWATKYRYKVLHGAMRERIRQIIIQTCEELGVHIVKGVLARDHVHMFLSIPPKLSLSDVMQRIKGRLIAPHPDGVPRPAQTLLGKALLGAWVFLHDLRQRDRRRDQTIPGITFLKMMPPASAGASFTFNALATHLKEPLDVDHLLATTHHTKGSDH